MSCETTTRRQEAQFDSVAEGYRQLVDENVQITGENSEYFADYKAKYLARVLSTVRANGRILDYGCGVGILARYLRRRVPKMQVDGFDVSANSLERIDPELRSQGVFTSDLAELGTNYEVVVLANVLHHIAPEERRSVVAEAASRLSPGGRIMIFEHNPLNPVTRWAVSHCPFDEGVVLLHSSEVRSLCLQALGSRPKTDYIVFFPRWLSWLRRFEPVLKWCPAGAQHATTANKP